MESGLIQETISVGDTVDRFVRSQPRLIFVPNPGNAGDGLINHSMYSILRKRGIPFTILETHKMTEPDGQATYLIMANGALHHGEHALDRLIRKIVPSNAKMILHSATIQDRDELLKSLPESTIIIARDPVTYAYVASVRPDLTTVLSEDATMAMMDGDADLPRPSLLRRLEYRVRLFRNTFQLGYPPLFALLPYRYRNGKKHGEVFYALRTDDESIATEAPPCTNVDLSNVCGGRQTEKHAEASAALFLGVIRSKKTIRTDRLHVAIGCCLMKVNCQLSANKYFKCEAIYKHSLVRRFDTIKWLTNS